jgi:hypothetical protein
MQFYFKVSITALMKYQKNNKITVFLLKQVAILTHSPLKGADSMISI